MKKFLLISGGLLVFALVAVVAVFFMVSRYIVDKSPKLPSVATTTETIKKTATNLATSTLHSIPDKGLPLSEVPLSDKQKAVAEAVGIDIEKFVITKEMIGCATEKVGETRVLEITAGDTPSAIEIAKLLPCLR